MMNTKIKVAPLIATIITFGSLSGGAMAQVVANLNIVDSNQLSISFSGALSGPAPSIDSEYVTVVFASLPPIGYQNPADVDFLSGRTSVSIDGSNPYMSGLLIQLDGEESMILYDNVPGGLTAGDIFSGTVTIDYDSPHFIPDGTQATVYWGKPATGTVQLVPEPSSSLLIGLGGIGFLLKRRR
mgnify:FL=1